MSSHGTATLEELLESWRTHRAPELADHIDRVAAGIGSPRTELSTLPKKSVHAAWMALSGHRAPADLGALLAALTVGTIDEIGERVAELGRWPEDPRIARAAVKLIETVPFQSTSSQKHWVKIFALATEPLDFRALAALQHVEKNPVAISGGSMRGWMAHAVAKGHPRPGAKLRRRSGRAHRSAAGEGRRERYGAHGSRAFSPGTDRGVVSSSRAGLPWRSSCQCTAGRSRAMWPRWSMSSSRLTSHTSPSWPSGSERTRHGPCHLFEGPTGSRDLYGSRASGARRSALTGG